MCLHCCIETITIDQVSSLCVHVSFKKCILGCVCVEPSQCSILNRLFIRSFVSSPVEPSQCSIFDRLFIRSFVSS